MPSHRHSYIAFYPSDWYAGTAGMTGMQRLVYFEICCFCWDHGTEVPEHEMARLMRGLRRWKAALWQLHGKGKVYVTADGSVGNTRALEEAKRAKELWEKRSKGGKISAAARSTLAKTAERQSAMTAGSSVSNSPPENQNQSQNQSQKERNKSELRSLRVLAPAFVLPDWISQEAWNGFTAMRAKQRKPLTERARTLVVANLAKLREQGHDANAVLDQSTERGWLGVFALKPNGDGSANAPKPLSEDEVWERRLQSFDRNGLWLPGVYGPEPGQPYCRVPETVLEAHRARAAQAANGGAP